MSSQHYNLFSYIISYLFFFALLWLSKVQKANRLINEQGLVSTPGILASLHVAGIFLFGLLPSFFNHSTAFVIYNGTAAIFWQLLVTLVLTILSIMASLKLAEQNYKQAVLRGPLSTLLSPSFINAYFLLRILFICAYECWFRGYLLTGCIAGFGVPIAILLNVGLYTILHSANGKEEVLGCIPFGLLLCCVCIWFGAVWPAIIIHLALTISYERRFLMKIKNQIIIR